MGNTLRVAVGQLLHANSDTLYRNLQVLGQGGNATTFLAMATSGDNRGVPFAIKVFRNLAKPERQASFFEEQRFLEHCEHPSIMRTYDAGIYGKKYHFIVAEYLPETLEQVIHSNQTQSIVKVSYALQLLSALAFLAGQASPVIHRDIKPQNIFVKGRSCVLGDFGLMKLVNKNNDNEELNPFKESIGAGMPFGYRTPDQVAYFNRQASITPKSDIFQLGLVLAELFTGKNPEKPNACFSDPVELEELGLIQDSPPQAELIAMYISQMLEMNPQKRKDSIYFLDQWDGIFKTMVKQTHDKGGRAIW